MSWIWIDWKSSLIQSLFIPAWAMMKAFFINTKLIDKERPNEQSLNSSKEAKAKIQDRFFLSFSIKDSKKRNQSISTGFSRIMSSSIWLFKEEGTQSRKITTWLLRSFWISFLESRKDIKPNQLRSWLILSWYRTALLLWVLGRSKEDSL